MQAHRFASRLLAALLTVTWATLALALLLTPAGTGLTRLLLALCAFVPALVSSAAVLLPVAVVGRQGWAAGWLGMSALLLAVPFAILIGGPLVAGLAQPIFPSAEIAYAGLLAVLATTVYGAHGWAAAPRVERAQPRPPGRRLSMDMRPVMVGIALTGLVAATSGVALATSDVALAGVPVDCGDVQIASYARITIDARANIDGTTIATASANGERSGSDEQWSGAAGGDALEDRVFEYSLIGGSALLRTDGAESQVVGDAEAAISGHLDGRVASVLLEPGLPPVEDLGVDLVDGAAARHCRISVGGEQAFRAFLPLAWLVGRAPLDRGPALEVWRGDLDWWSFADGRLGRATVVIGGHPADAWTISGLRGTLRAEMRVVERDVPRTIDEPLR